MQTHIHDGAPGGERLAHPLIPAGRVNGADVYSPSGEKLGNVEDVALDKAGGQVAYAILKFGGFLGMGERYHPVPWSLLHYDVSRHGYVVPMEKDALQAAPSFEAHELSGWDDTDVRGGIFNFYQACGAAPYWMWGR